MAISEKTWWAPVWRGLVVDPTGKHFRQLKGAVWLLLYLILHADRRTGWLVRKQATISRDMNVSLWTIRAWMRRLRDLGYIRADSDGRATRIEVLRWRGVGYGSAGQSSTGVPLSQAKMQHVAADDRAGGLVGRGEIDAPTIPNKNTFTRVLLRDKKRVVKKPFSSFSRSEARPERALTREELLARDLADGLGDAPHLSSYRAYAWQYPESLLRLCLSEARAIPDSRIKRSRGALFQSLLRQHGNELPEDSRH